MAETKPGGAYLRADGKTWVNANGEPIEAPSRAETEAQRAERTSLERQQAEAAAELARQRAETEVPAVRRARS